ncbi:MAG TPA: GNAT family protein [Acidimicrobiales bacterium]|jgi:RimJ/RimL family protein N-acetyltransferase|nr:GNAT family protein [Acidimicrobiales bacterium]
MRTSHWPLFDLTVHTPRLELRYPDDDLVAALAELGGKGIHDPATMPFSMPWTDLPPGELERGALQFLWRTRASWQPTEWSCPMAVVVDGEPLGVQDLTGSQFAVTKTVKTGSWLTRTRQGEGIGTEMRAAILHLAFAGLGADRACTSAYHDNHPSLGVTRAMGYKPNGDSIELRRDQADRQLHFVLSRERWQERRRDDIEIEGLGPCLELFGAATS